MAKQWTVLVGGEVVGKASTMRPVVMSQRLGDVVAEDGDVRIDSISATSIAFRDWLLDRPPRKIPSLDFVHKDGRKVSFVDVWCRSSQESQKSGKVLWVIFCPRVVRGNMRRPRLSIEEEFGINV